MQRYHGASCTSAVNSSALGGISSRDTTRADSSSLTTNFSINSRWESLILKNNGLNVHSRSSSAVKMPIYVCIILSAVLDWIKSGDGISEWHAWNGWFVYGFLWSCKCDRMPLILRRIFITFLFEVQSLTGLDMNRCNHTLHNYFLLWNYELSFSSYVSEKLYLAVSSWCFIFADLL